MRAPSGTKKKSQGERGGASRVDVTLTDTTAPEARSTAATRAVRRVVPTWASAVCAATCAAAVLTDTVSARVVAPGSRQAAAENSRRSTPLRIGHRRAAGREGLGALEVLFRRIAGAYEVEAVRWGRRTGALIVACLEQQLDVAERAPSQADIHHRAYQHPHHVM